MKKCISYKNVTDKYGRTIKRCAEFSDASTPVDDSPLADAGLGQLPDVWDGYGEDEGEFDLNAVLGPAVGGGAALGVTLLTRAFTKPGSKVGQYAGLIGAGAGMVLSVPIGFLRGWNTAIAGMITAALTGLNCYLSTLVTPKMAMAELPAGTAEGYGMIIGSPIPSMDGYGQLIEPSMLNGYDGIVASEPMQGYGEIAASDDDVTVFSGLGQDGVEIFEGFGEGDSGESAEVLEGVNFGAFGTPIVS
jgi:hypothetical protein